MYVTIVSTNSIITADWTERASPLTNWQIQDSGIGFSVNTTHIPAGAQIVSMYLNLYVDVATNTGPWTGGAYYAFYEGKPYTTPVDSQFGGADFKMGYTTGSKRLSEIKHYGEFTEDTWARFYITGDGGYAPAGVPLADAYSYLMTPDSNGIVWLYYMTTNHATGVAPSQQAGGGNSPSLHFYGYAFPDSAHRPQLIIEYTTAIPARVTAGPSNAALGSENLTGEITAISWLSPRTGYGDETARFDVTGDVGTPLSLELVTSGGAVLSTKVDHIRSDGHYYWAIDVPDNQDSFVRVRDTGQSVFSLWGYVAPKPGTNEASNTVYSVDTNAPQYTSLFTKFITHKGGSMFVHWKTNIDATNAGERADHEVRLYHLGRSTDLVYSDNLTHLASTYFLNSAANDGLLGWRYMIFTLDGSAAGFNDYDDLVVDLAQTTGGESYGFYQPLIYKLSTAAELTTSHSAYWSLANDSDGVNIALSKSVYSDNDTVAVTVTVGTSSQCLGFLNGLNFEIWDQTGANQYGSAVTSLAGAKTGLSLVGPTVIGSYYARIKLSHPLTSFVYERWLPFTVTSGGVVPGGPGSGGTTDVLKAILDAIDGWLTGLGFNTDAGHWVILFLGMVLTFLVAYKDRVMRLVLPLCLLGVAFAINWVDRWLIVLLACGAGVWLWKTTRKQIAGGPGE
jgi:hypothetical protein